MGRGRTPPRRRRESDPAMRAGPWLRPMAARATARARLFCVPYAGAGASVFTRWPRLLPDHVEIVAVQLPGREDRAAEAPFELVEPLVDALVPVLRRHLDRPYGLYGHSMGALVAYETARRLTAMGRGPQLLVASGQR